MILVTGATGTNGRPLVNALASQGAAVRAIAHRPGPAGLPTDVEVVAGDLSRPDTIVSALRDVTALFVPPRAVGLAAPVLLALAAENGVQHVAALSAINVDNDPAYQPSRFNGDRNKEVEDDGVPTTSSKPVVTAHLAVSNRDERVSHCAATPQPARAAVGTVRPDR